MCIVVKVEATATVLWCTKMSPHSFCVCFPPRKIFANKPESASYQIEDDECFHSTSFTCEMMIESESQLFYLLSSRLKTR